MEKKATESQGPAPRSASYFYAGGHRIEIELDRSQFAVDLSHDVQGEHAAAWARVKSDARPLAGAIGVIPATAMPPELARSLDAKGALHPVYRHGDATMIVLPEVRVEVDPTEEPALDAAIERAPVRARIMSRDDGQLVLRPETGRGADALALANYLRERVRTNMVQARSLQIFPRPGVVSSSR